MKRFLTHLYIIVMGIFIVTTGNILADKYGSTLSSKVSSVINSADNEMNNMQQGVKDWNKKILK